MDDLFDPDILQRIAAVARRLYSQDRMGADQMRNAAQMLHSVVSTLDPDFNLNERNATYDARLK